MSTIAALARSAAEPCARGEEVFTTCDVGERHSVLRCATRTHGTAAPPAYSHDPLTKQYLAHGVLGLPLGCSALAGMRRVDGGQVAAPPRQRLWYGSSKRVARHIGAAGLVRQAGCTCIVHTVDCLPRPATCARHCLLTSCLPAYPNPPCPQPLPARPLPFSSHLHITHALAFREHLRLPGLDAGQAALEGVLQASQGSRRQPHGEFTPPLELAQL